MKEMLTTCGELAGAALASYGFYLAWHPLGYMLLGLLIAAISLVVAL